MVTCLILLLAPTIPAQHEFPGSSPMAAQARAAPIAAANPRMPTTCQFPIFLVIWLVVKTTVELPDELVREVKVRAAREGRRLKDVMAEVVRRGLADPPPRKRTTPSRVRLPLVQCVHPATPDQEMTPEWTAQILQDSEVSAAGAADESLR